jgi:Putative peptidoglycan binding domain
MNCSLRIALIGCATLFLAVLCRPATARAQPPDPSQPVLTIRLLEKESLGPRRRTPLHAHLAKADGTPIAGALLIFSVDGRRDGMARTDATGNAAWRIQHALAAGRYTVQGVFEGRPGLPPARTVFTLEITTAAMTLQAAPVPVGTPLELAVQIRKAAGGPLADAPVALFVNGKRLATGHSAADGTLTLRSKHNLPAGDYQAEAVFDGLPGVLPTRATTQLTVNPTWLEIETVPRLTGARFALDGQQFVSDQAGIARIAVQRSGNYTLSVLPWEPGDDGMHATFARWMDDVFAPQRRMRLPTGGRVQVGFDISYQVRASFLDLANRPVDPGIVSSVVVTSSDRTRYTLSATQARWLPGSRVVRLEQGLEARPIGYVAGNVLVNGSNVVNQGQQRFDPTHRQDWPIQLLLYSTHFIVRDAMFGFPIGSSLRLTYPDGIAQEWPLGPDGELTTGLLARGGYSASVKAPGISAAIPIVLSRDQEVRLIVISYLDLAVLGVIFAVIGLGLLFVGRPRLVWLLCRPRALAGELLRIARAAKLPSLSRCQLRPIQIRLRVLDPMVVIATLLVVVGVGGVASATRFTPTTYATSAQPQANAPPNAPPLAAAATPAPLFSAQPTTMPVLVPTRVLDPEPQIIATEPQIVAAEPHTFLSFNAQLRSASKGQEVAQLQQRLRELGYFTYPENTGHFGEITHAAVTQFQADQNLPVTGIVGPLTIEAINNCDSTCARPAGQPEEPR